LNAETRPARWNGLVISFHWFGAAIILALIAIGWAMVYSGLDAASTFDLFQLHKSLGFTALALTVARFAARFASSSPPAPISAQWELRLATVAQVSLYVLTVCAIVTGWLVVSTSPLPVPTRFFGLFVIPNVAQPDPSVFAAAALAHKLTAWGTAILIALHAAGALKHHFFNRDDILRRMLPAWPKHRFARR
jgi:cytochrome b561